VLDAAAANSEERACRAAPGQAGKSAERIPRAAFNLHAMDSDGGAASDGGSPRVGLSALSAETLAALQSVLTERAAAAETAAADPFRRGPLPSAHALSRHAAPAPYASR
jgi:hypothetical protein